MAEAAERPQFSHEYLVESTILEFTIAEVLRHYREAVTHDSPGSRERTLGFRAAPAEPTPKGFHKLAFCPNAAPFLVKPLYGLRDGFVRGHGVRSRDPGLSCLAPSA